MTAIANIGAIFGGIGFGWLSERVGRRGAIMLRGIAGIAGNPFLGIWHQPLSWESAPF